MKSFEERIKVFPNVTLTLKTPFYEQTGKYDKRFIQFLMGKELKNESHSSEVVAPISYEPFGCIFN